MATKSNELNLTSKQRKLAELLANPDFIGSITELCRECGVARSTYYKWLDKPEFTQYVDSLISKFTSSELSTVWKALILSLIHISALIIFCKASLSRSAFGLKPAAR